MQRRSNPVLDADWPDPDAIRVGSEYWMIASSFNRAPGLPVLRSRDLVDFEHVTNALPALPQSEHYRLPRRGSGVWASSIREHDGTFFIVYPDPDHGIFVLSAPHPSGPWSEPWMLLEGHGLIDPCPVWDEDGRAYLIHGWARSRAGVKNRLTLLEVSPDLRRPLTPGTVVIDGDDIPGTRTLEGPKLYRKDGWYWVLAPAGGVADGYQLAFRARSIHGPYEHRVVLEQGDSPVNGPHQGALVDDTEGNWWFLHFQDRGIFGRVTHTQPVHFDAEGWPHMGTPIDEQRGEPVAVVPELPRVGGTSADEDGAAVGEGGGSAAESASPGEYREPSRSDDFSANALHPRWHWQANPRPEWYALAGDGHVDLAFAPSARGDLRDLGAVLGQQMPGRPSVWSTELTLPAPASGAGRGTAPSDGALPSDAALAPDGAGGAEDRAGVVVLGLSYAWAGLRRSAEGIMLESATMDAEGAEETTRSRTLVTGDSRSEAHVGLEVEIDELGRVCFRAFEAGPGSVAPDELLSQWQSTKGRWIGAEVGLFATTSHPVLAPIDARRARFGPVTVRCEGRDA